MQKQAITGHGAALFTMLVWGTTSIATKVLLRSFEPVEILFFRFLLGLLMLTLVYPHRLRGTTRRQELLLAVTGFCGLTLYYLLESTSLLHTQASNVGVLVTVSPMFTALLNWRFCGGEKPGLGFVLGFGAAIAGIACISFNGSVALQLSPVGDLLAIAAAFIWAVYSLLTRRVSEMGYNMIQTTRRTFLYGVLFLIPALFLLPGSWDYQRFAQPVNLGSMLYLGLFASAVCFLTWNTAVKIIGPVRSNVYVYAMPVITVAASVLVLHEQITPLAGVGMALTLVGLLLSGWKPRGSGAGEEAEPEPQAEDAKSETPPQP